MKNFALILVAFSGLAGAFTDAHAASVSYPGSNCKPVVEGTFPMYGGGIVQNIDSNARHGYECPFQHSGGEISSIVVRVVDRHGADNVICRFVVTNALNTSDVIRGPERQTSGNNSTPVSLSLGSIADANISTSHSGSIFCRLPQALAGSNFSAITGYRVTEVD